MSLTKATSGYALQIHSWENDGDFCASTILWGLDQETVDDVVKILETLKRINQQRVLHRLHYEELFLLCTERVMLEIAKYRRGEFVRPSGVEEIPLPKANSVKRLFNFIDLDRVV